MIAKITKSVPKNNLQSQRQNGSLKFKKIKGIAV